MGQVRNVVNYHPSNRVGDQLQALSSIGWIYKVTALGVEAGRCMMGYSLGAKRCSSDRAFIGVLPFSCCFVATQLAGRKISSVYSVF
jgi:hypothetical protein